MPAYALRVIARTIVLRRSLAIAREQGSPDVPLYRAALRSADVPTVAAGLIVLVGVPLLLGVVAAFAF